MATSLFEILDGFSLVWVPMYKQSKSAFLLVTSNFELVLMDISMRHSQSDFANSFALTFTVLHILRMVSICSARLFFGVCYYEKHPIIDHENMYKQLTQYNQSYDRLTKHI